MKTPIRTVVAGSTFGRFYLAALAQSSGFETVGLLSNGSQRSADCARHYGIAHFTDPDDVPGDVDLVCVAIRSGAMGGQGSEIAGGLLERGMSVMQEHPVHHDDVAVALRTARRHGAAYRVGDLYPHLPAVQRFTAAARELSSITPIESIGVDFATQVAYPAIEIVAAALGALRPWRLEKVRDAVGPFSLVAGEVGGVPAVLRVHNEVDPGDPDNHLQMLHRITLNTGLGALTLVDTHGPVIWTPRLHVPECVKNEFDFVPEEAGHLVQSTGSFLGPAEPPTQRDALSNVWPSAIGEDLSAFATRIRDGRDDRVRTQQTLTACALWRNLTETLGYPRLRTGRYTAALDVNRLTNATPTGGH